MVYLLIFIFALQQFDGNILGPKILGNTTGLSSFWVLFSITFFGGLWGIVGMIVGVPLFAVIYDLVGKCIRYFLRLRGISQEQEEAAALTVQVPAERAGGSICKMRVGMTCRDVFISEKKGAREGETQRAWIR